jgi:hypothetical protein
MKKQATFVGGLDKKAEYVSDRGLASDFIVPTITKKFGENIGYFREEIPLRQEVRVKPEPAKSRGTIKKVNLVKLLEDVKKETQPLAFIDDKLYTKEKELNLDMGHNWIVADENEPILRIKIMSQNDLNHVEIKDFHGSYLRHEVGYHKAHIPGITWTAEIELNLPKTKNKDTRAMFNFLYERLSTYYKAQPGIKIKHK